MSSGEKSGKGEGEMVARTCSRDDLRAATSTADSERAQNH